MISKQEWLEKPVSCFDYESESWVKRSTKSWLGAFASGEKVEFGDREDAELSPALMPSLGWVRPAWWVAGARNAWVKK